MNAARSSAFWTCLGWLLPAIGVAGMHFLIIAGTLFEAHLDGSETAYNLCVALSLPVSLLPSWPRGPLLWLSSLLWGALVGLALRWRALRSLGSSG